MSCHAFRASAARYLLLALLLSTLALFTPSAEAGGTTYQLSPGDDIQAAITKSVSGDTIQLSAGTYNITTTLDTLGKGIMLIGEVDIEGVPISVLDGGHVVDVTDGVRVLICQQGEGPDTVFQNLVVQNGYSVDDPAAVRSEQMQNALYATAKLWRPESSFRLCSPPACIHHDHQNT